MHSAPVPQSPAEFEGDPVFASSDAYQRAAVPHLDQMPTAAGQVGHMEDIASRRVAAPHQVDSVAALTCFIPLKNHRQHHVAVRQVVAVTGAVRFAHLPFAVQTMLRIHFMQQTAIRSAPRTEEKRRDTPLFRAFARLGWDTRFFDASTIPRFRQLLEKHQLAEQPLVLVNELLRNTGLLLLAGTAVDAALTPVPTTTKNAGGERDPTMHQTKECNQWYVDMKAHIGVDAKSDHLRTVRGTAANVTDVFEANSLLHGQKSDLFAYAGYGDVRKRSNAKPGVNWHVAMRPRKRRT